MKKNNPVNRLAKGNSNFEFSHQNPEIGFAFGDGDTNSDFELVSPKYHSGHSHLRIQNGLSREPKNHIAWSHRNPRHAVTHDTHMNTTPLGREHNPHTQLTAKRLVKTHGLVKNQNLRYSPINQNDSKPYWFAEKNVRGKMATPVEPEEVIEKMYG